jgi:hypothetical protein
VNQALRIRITLAGVIVLVLGLIVAGIGLYRTNAPSEYAGAIVTVIGLIAGIVGAAMTNPVARPAAAPSSPPAGP